MKKSFVSIVTFLSLSFVSSSHADSFYHQGMVYQCPAGFRLTVYQNGDLTCEPNPSAVAAEVDTFEYLGYRYTCPKGLELIARGSTLTCEAPNREAPQVPAQEQINNSQDVSQDIKYTGEDSQSLGGNRSGATSDPTGMSSSNPRADSSLLQEATQNRGASTANESDDRLPNPANESATNQTATLLNLPTLSPEELAEFSASAAQHDAMQSAQFGPVSGHFLSTPKDGTLLDVPPGGTFNIVLNGMSDTAGQLLVDAARVWLKALGRDGFTKLVVTRDLNAPQPRVVVQPMGTRNHQSSSDYGQAFSVFGDLELTPAGHNPLTAKHELGHLLGFDHLNATGTMHERALHPGLSTADLAGLQELITCPRHQAVTQAWNEFFHSKDQSSGAGNSYVSR